MRYRECVAGSVVMTLIFSLFFLNVKGQNVAQASFSVSDTIGCAPLQVGFTNHSSGGAAYHWDFGNGNSSSSVNPSNVYTSPGDYTAVLTVTGKDGNAYSYSMNIKVVDNPVAGFVLSKNTICAGESIDFTAQSKNATQWIWDFGDGKTIKGEQVSHVYSAAGTYTIKQIASNSYGCNDVAVSSNAVTVHAAPKVSFSMNPSSSCDSSQEFTFKSAGSNAKSYSWDFGDGTTSTLAGPKHTYNKNGSFVVKLTGTSSTGCQATYQKKDPLLIKSPVAPEISSPNTNACVNSIVRFVGRSKDSITSWKWEFGDGATSLSQNPVHHYTKEGSYSVSLTTVNGAGCTMQTSYSNFITVKGDITPKFTATSSGCGSVSLKFDNQTANAAQYSWDFGDGTTSTDQFPEHNYTKTGSYNVTLHAFGASGCENIYSVKKDVEVYAIPEAGFQLSTHAGCPPLKIQFTNKSKGAATVKWDFGDGTTSTDLNPEHTYTSEGNFVVKQMVYSAHGCSGVLADSKAVSVSNIYTNLTHQATEKACVPFTTSFYDGSNDNSSWLWAFGDGTFSTDQNPSHTYTQAGIFHVNLVTKTNDGCTQVIKDYQVIELQKPGKAGFVTKNIACPAAILFQDTTTGSVNWSWSFGDGTNGVGNDITHAYIKNGDYLVTLTIQNAYGCTEIVTKTITCTNAFYARISPSRADSVFPAKIQFHSSSVGVKTYAWDFGDGTHSTLSDPQHTFTVPGIYTVTLKCSNGPCQLIDSVILFNKNIIKSQDTARLKANFGAYSVTGCAPFFATFMNRSTKATSYLWNFGDGTRSTVQNPTHLYQDPGNYSVSLVVRDMHSGIDSVVKSSFIRIGNPVARFKIHESVKIDQTEIAFEDSSTNAAAWFWDFGDGTYSQDQNPVHTYTNGGTAYNVTLTVTAPAGCTNSSSILVNTGFKNLFGSVPKKGCVSDTLHFKSSASGYAGYDWDFGDGRHSAVAQVGHVYTRAGYFNISLILTDKKGFTYRYYNPDSIEIDSPVAKFDFAGPASNCDSLTVAFNNLSYGATSYMWQFSDGTTSTLRSPVHTFNKEGFASINLTVTKNACRATYKMPQAIYINKAHPAFTLTQSNYCAPLTAVFTDKSDHATSWLWDFGDGYKSSSDNPVHPYTTAPKSNIKLTIVDINGCKGSTTSALSLLKARFTPSVTTGCGPLAVVFSDNSPHASKWVWNFGDGTVSYDRNPVHVYKNDGEYDVSLAVQSTSGCMDSVHFSKYINVSRPSVAFTSPAKASCAPSYVTFVNSSANATSYSWDFGDSTYSTLANPGHIYNMPGTYTVKLIARNAGGCADTLIRKNYVKVLGPVSSFKTSELKGCPGLSVTFTNTSQSAVSNSWNFGDGTASTDISPTHVYHNPGNYIISLITHDSYGCTSLATQEPGVHIYDSTPPAAVHIQRVTVTSNNSVNLSWSAVADPLLKGYRIYRQNNATKAFELIAEIDDSSVSAYEDKSVNTLANAWTYKVQAVNICGNGVDLANLTAHTTINLTAKGDDGKIRLSWTPYLGCSISGYSILRQEQGANPVLIATVGPDVLTYNDRSIVCPESVGYRIIANDICGNPLISFSDTAVGTLMVKNDTIKINIVKSTVLPDKTVLTEWQTPEEDINRIGSFKIERSSDNMSFSTIDSVDQMATSYIDASAKTDRQNYYYRIVPVLLCNSALQKGAQGSTILLKADAKGENIQLNWNGYTGWDKGVDYYIIEKTDENGNWQFFKKTMGNVTHAVDKR